MLLNAFPYFLLVTILFIIYWFIVPTHIRSRLFLIFSFGLLLHLFPTHTMLILIISSVVYFAGELIISAKPICRNTIFVLTILGTLGFLVYYKYLLFFIQVIKYVNLSINIPFVFENSVQKIPIGLSFFTFRFIHYLIEVKRGNIKHRGYLEFLTYTFFFPIVVAGPIERYDRFEQQHQNINGFKWKYLNYGISRIMLGLFKKVVIADSLALFARGLNNPELDGLSYLIAIYAFTFKIYFDFSGYSDIAIGTARLFGYRIMENFNAPYLKRNISLFWKSWHMSLTSWFRDYLFIPLGGSRGTLGRTIINTLIVMIATGIWHGAAFHFIAWGLYHAVGLIILRLYNLFIAIHLSDSFKNSRIATVISIALTFNFTAFGWIFFETSVHQSIHIMRVVFHLN
ncbi:MAG: MBOAT family protein [Pelotomaculum sp.]|nr:MBOAT family protein [Pelotomaculum sp.]